MNENNKIRKIVREAIEEMDKDNLLEFEFLKRAAGSVKNAFSSKDATSSAPVQNATQGTKKTQSIPNVDEPIKVDFIQKKDGSYELNGNKILKLNIVGVLNYKKFLSDNKDNANLSWLFKSKFYAQELEIDKNGRVLDFIGEWLSGDFKGLNFYLMPGTEIDWDKIAFKGGSFIGGKFGLNYNYWKITPLNFVDGTITKKTNGGILGLKNIGNEIVEDYVHLIQVPVGKYIFIKLQGSSKIYPIEVIKRLDDKNSDFIFKNHLDNKQSIVKWSTIRENYNKLFIKNGRKSFIIPGVISLSGLIEYIEITDDINKLGKIQKDSIKKSVYNLNLKKIPSIFGDLTSSISSDNVDPSVLPRLNSIISDINNDGGKVFLNHLKNIFDEISLTRHKINRKDVSGIKYINSVMGSILNEQLDSDVIESLKYINNFVLYIKKYTENSDEILGKLEDYIDKKAETIKFIDGENEKKDAKPSEKGSLGSFLNKS